MRSNVTMPAHFPKPRGALACLTALCLLAFGTVSAQSVLEEVSFSTGSGGSVDVILTLDGEVPEPQVFTTDNPARIAIDLPNTTNGLRQRSIEVGAGATRSVSAVEAGGRTRVVIDLFRSAPFETRTEGNRLVVAVQGGAGSAIVSNAQRRQATMTRSSSADLAVQNVDFRRGANGEGRIIVTFNDGGANVDLTRQGDRLRAYIYNASLPPELEQRLDVLDFATPVEMIDAYRDGNRIRLDIAVRGEFEHLAFQTGNQYVVEVQEFEAEVLTPEEAILQPPEYEGTRVTFNFQDIPVRAVLQLIADVSGLNIVVSDSVSGNVTLRLQNVPWDQALDILLQAKSLDMRENGNVIWVAPASEIAAREQQMLQALKDKRELEPLRSTFIQVNYAKATDLKNIIESAASSTTGGDGGSGLLSARGSVTVDERTNVLLLTDTSDRLEEVRELVNRLDRPVRQIQIESRIVIASDSFSDEMGVRFGLTGGYQDNDGNITSVAGSSTATDRMNNLALVNRQINPNRSGFPVIAPDNPPAGISVPPLGERLNVNLPASSTAGSWAIGILTSDYLLDLELSALESEGRGEVISSPRLITANQREAFIQQGVEIPFQQASSSGATNISFKEAVLELRVQPLITPDDRVILDLAVKKDTVGQLVPVEGGGQVPSIDTREIQTQVLIDSGQTVVLGGIFEQTIREDENKVPLLGDIPGLGALFRQRSSQNDKSELLIFITPTILNENVTLDY